MLGVLCNQTPRCEVRLKKTGIALSVAGARELRSSIETLLSPLSTHLATAHHTASSDRALASAGSGGLGDMAKVKAVVSDTGRGQHPVTPSPGLLTQASLN